MKTKKKNKAVANILGKITNTTRAEIGANISFMLDLLSDPRFKEDVFRQIVEHNVRSYNLHASSDEITLHFTIEWEGGKGL